MSPTKQGLAVRHRVGDLRQPLVGVGHPDVFGLAAVDAAAQSPAAVGVGAVVDPARGGRKSTRRRRSPHSPSPGRRGGPCETALPTASTTPTISWPTVMPGTARGTEPCLMCRSLVQMLERVTRTTASRGSWISRLGLVQQTELPLFDIGISQHGHASFACLPHRWMAGILCHQYTPCPLSAQETHQPVGEAESTAISCKKEGIFPQKAAKPRFVILLLLTPGADTVQ